MYLTHHPQGKCLKLWAWKFHSFRQKIKIKIYTTWFLVWGRKHSKHSNSFDMHQSVSQFSHSVMSNSLQPHESQHTRPPCPSPTPRVHSDSHPSSQWCHPAISSSVIPFSSCPQSLPASGSFQWVNSSYEVAEVLELQPQHQSFQWTSRTDLL